MSWPRFSDDFPDDCWSLSDAAFRLHVEALCWSARKWLDCRIPKDDLRRFAKHPEAAPELVSIGWWADDGADYVIRHHKEHQRTREQAIAIQDRNRENGAKGGRPRKKRPSAETQMGSQMATEMETQGEKEKEKEKDWPRSEELPDENDRDDDSTDEPVTDPWAFAPVRLPVEAALEPRVPSEPDDVWSSSRSQQQRSSELHQQALARARRERSRR